MAPGAGLWVGVNLAAWRSLGLCRSLQGLEHLLFLPACSQELAKMVLSLGEQTRVLERVFWGPGGVLTDNISTSHVAPSREELPQPQEGCLKPACSWVMLPFRRYRTVGSHMCDSTLMCPASCMHEYEQKCDAYHNTGSEHEFPLTSFSFNC